jgi:hypothetical protein
MRLDLRQEFADCYAYVVARVTAFDPATDDGPGDPGPVRFIEFGYELEQAGWAVLVFDKRPDAEPDGEWTLSIDGNDLARPHWLKAASANGRRPVTLVRLDGTESELPVDSPDLVTSIGDMLKTVLVMVRGNGVFSSLPKAPGCELGVEHFNGEYGWPEYDDRGKENLV